MDNKVKVPAGTSVTYALKDGTTKQGTTLNDCIGSSTIFIDGPDRWQFYLEQEGTWWVRGWTGKVVTAFKRTIATKARERKLAEAKKERERDEERAAATVKYLRQAAAVVKRAKLPRELRVAAFAGMIQAPSYIPYTLR